MLRKRAEAGTPDAHPPGCRYTEDTLQHRKARMRTHHRVIFLFAALAIVWLAIIGYLVVLSGRLGALQRELHALKQADDSVEDRDS